MTPYQDDEDKDPAAPTNPPVDTTESAGNPGFFSKLIQANNDAYQQRKQLSDQSNAIALDKINMDVNPDLPGPRQDSSVLAQPSPIEQENLEQNILPMATAGSLGSGGGPKQLAQRLENLAVKETPRAPITTQGIQNAMNAAQQIRARPALAQTPKAQMLFQKLETMIKNGRVRGVPIPGEE